MEQNWIVFTSLWFDKKSLRDIFIQGMATWNSWEKIKSAIPCEQNYTAWLVKYCKTVFSKLTQKISLLVSDEQASRQASPQPGVFLSQNFRYFPSFQVVTLVKYTVLFVLGKCLMDSEEVILIFTEVWFYNFHVSQ